MVDFDNIYHLTTFDHVPIMVQKIEAFEAKCCFYSYLRFIFQLCKKMKVDMISSRPYHPQSQGKVERSHRELRNKIHYGMVKLSTKGGWKT